MSCQKLSASMIAVTLVMSFVGGCGAGTPIPPPSASTPVPPASSPSMGISAPVTIEGVQLQVASIEEADTYNMGGQDVQPNSGADTILLIDVTIKNADYATTQGWKGKVSVTDENGQESEPELTQTSTEGKGGGSVSAIKWIFVVAKSSRSFMLSLPGGQTVKLDSLLKK